MVAVIVNVLVSVEDTVLVIEVVIVEDIEVV